MPPPIVTATVQSVVLAATSNIIAQALTAYNEDKPLVVDYVPLFQFALYALVNTPPNFLWQDFLEQTFPAFHMAPTSEAIASASADDDKALDEEAEAGRLVEPKLNVCNTAVKVVLDQTVGGAINTFLFSMFLHSIQSAMAHRPAGQPERSLGFLASPGAIDYGAVDWRTVVARSRGEFATLLLAGWRLWPLVSLVNFAFVKTVEMRNLVGGLAGVAWGVYVSLFTAR